MRIAHVTATFPPYQGGTGNVCLHQARELARLGHDVHVFTARQSGTAPCESLDGFNTYRLRPVFQIGNAPVLPGLLRALSGFDVIHLHYPFILGAELVRLASMLHHTPLLITLHNDLIGIGARAPLFSLYQCVSARVTVSRAARLLVLSRDHYASSRLRSRLSQPEPVCVELPNGVDTDRFSPSQNIDQARVRWGIPSSARLILFAAALDRAHHFKGFGTLLEALRWLPPDVRLLAIGDGDLRATYARQAEQVGVADRVVFTGVIAHEAMPPFFRGADLTVLPSSPPESFGLVLIESLACGTPVIASNIPGVRTVVEDGSDGLLVRPGDALDLTAKIQLLLDDPQRRIAMGKQGRLKVEERYSWTRVVQQLEAQYWQVVGEQRTGVRVAPGVMPR